MFHYYVLNPDKSVRGTNDHLEWARMFENHATRVVKREGAGGVTVSTVFLGIDHRFGDGGPPLLFETMVFGLPDDEEICERYSTWADAEAGHTRIVALMLARQPAN